jgi:hypothetical protein
MAKLTNLGADALAAAATDGTKVSFSKIKIGDGSGVVPVFTGSESSLVNEVTEIDVTAVYRRTENPNYVYIEGVIPFNNGGYTIREACAVDELGRLLVIGDYAEIPKPADTSPQAREILIRMVAVIENNISVINLFNFSGGTGSVVSGGYPVGTVVENYLEGNDPAAQAWVKLGPNVSADLRVYPKLADLSLQGGIFFDGVTANNLSSLRTAVAGSWNFCNWNILNGIHIVVARESAGATNYYRIFTSSDGILFEEKGNAAAGVAINTTRTNLYYLNGKYFLVTPHGLFESSNSGATWSKKTSGNYCSMSYFSGLYVFGGINDDIYTSADLVTYTSRYVGADGGEITNFKEFDGKLFAFKYLSGNQFKLRSSVNGTVWTALVIASYVHPGAIGYAHGEVIDGKLLYISNGSFQGVIRSQDGVSGWEKVNSITCDLYYGRSTIVAIDTLYSKQRYTTDVDGYSSNALNGLSYGGSAGAGFGMSSSHIYYGNLTYTSLSLFRFPISENKFKVYLPNLENKAIKVM